MSMDVQMNEIKQDIKDLNSLLENASRQKSKDILSIEIRKLQTELVNLQNKVKGNTEPNAPKRTEVHTPKSWDIKLNNYAWDQSDNFVKIYVTLVGVQTLATDSIYCNFSERSMDLHVRELDQKNYELHINNLAEEIDPSKSTYKVKTDMILVSLAKKAKKVWTCITKVEKILKESKAMTPPSMNDSNNPDDSLMSMMKKMYQEGDDELKRTIAKAWTEGEEKRAKGLVPH
ncbi:hypothetical protein QAD02_016634 [Eretmocerus hayati]|uniref:Uncharacterized protein n=1 Tax=Eretmocerus hayati TaxID=131215 RepID=A0ACC2PEH6_9HYME|nr:hypothetical protein QAD02_016634 [Eretmocerus hayati]